VCSILSGGGLHRPASHSRGLARTHYGVAVVWKAATGAGRGSASGVRLVLVVTLGQRAATGGWGCNHYAATGAVGHGATMQLARRPCGTCARLGKWWRLVIAVTLGQRAAAGAWDRNHYAATGALGRGVTMHLSRRTIGINLRFPTTIASVHHH
jgi:hypothetical protein